MSASNTVDATVIAPPARSNVDFWNDETVDINSGQIKQRIPTIPDIEKSLQVVRGEGLETLAYLALQILKSDDKLVIIRALASACAYLMDDRMNYTGSKQTLENLTGLEPMANEESDVSTTLTTNFRDAEDVTIEEMLNLMTADDDELGAYFGVLFLASTKRVTAKNRSAFNERRKDAAVASIIGDPVIFISDSMFLTDHVLEKVYASMLSYAPVRANIVSKVVNQLGKPHMGPTLAFINMFLLLSDSGMSAMRIIKEAVLKHPWIRTDFPELKPEFTAANNGQKAIKAAPIHIRPFLKAIHGNAFVPVIYSEIDNLTGVCKEVLKLTTPSYKNYDGGKITEAQRATIARHLDPITSAVIVEAE